MARRMLDDQRVMAPPEEAGQRLKLGLSVVQ
jgi:hypothetical protein